MSSNDHKMTAKELEYFFFKELHAYNSSNFKAIAKADLTRQDATVHKAFSSAVTRYFIFREKHPEISDSEFKMLYFKLKLDLVAAYFSEFPETDTDNLVGFQIELKHYLRDTRNKGDEEGVLENEQATPISDIKLESNNEVQIEQQQESVPVAI